ncbi:hypothetical protein GGS20DRAFT_590796 [Poronia punctata]|nr:hypothetical protein GGS20DRAFT_590796 [Poronia punctata]
MGMSQLTKASYWVATATTGVGTDLQADGLVRRLIPIYHPVIVGNNPAVCSQNTVGVCLPPLRTRGWSQQAQDSGRSYSSSSGRGTGDYQSRVVVLLPKKRYWGVAGPSAHAHNKVCSPLPFRDCRHLPGYQNGACASCVYQSHGRRCTHFVDPAAANDDNDDDDDDEGEGVPAIEEGGSQESAIAIESDEEESERAARASSSSSFPTGGRKRDCHGVVGVPLHQQEEVTRGVVGGAQPRPTRTVWCPARLEHEDDDMDCRLPLLKKKAETLSRSLSRPHILSVLPTPTTPTPSCLLHQNLPRNRFWVRRSTDTPGAHPLPSTTRNPLSLFASLCLFQYRLARPRLLEPTFRAVLLRATLTS